MAQFLNSMQAKADEQGEQVKLLQAVNEELKLQYQAMRDVLAETFNLVQALKVENAVLRREVARRKQDNNEAQDDGADGE